MESSLNIFLVLELVLNIFTAWWAAFPTLTDSGLMWCQAPVQWATPMRKFNTHTQGNCMRAISETSTIKLHVSHSLHTALKWHNTDMHFDLMMYRNELNEHWILQLQTHRHRSGWHLNVMIWGFLSETFMRLHLDNLLIQDLETLRRPNHGISRFLHSHLSYAAKPYSFLLQTKKMIRPRIRSRFVEMI